MAEPQEFGFDALSNALDHDVDVIETNVDYNALGQAIDTTWGRTSTPQTNQYSVKLHIDGPNRLVASYAAIVNFGTEREIVEMKRRYADESRDAIAAIIKAAKNRYKSITGSSITVKELATTDSLEITGVNFYNPRRSAYYRRKTVFELA